jgi:glycosyltransferase involved in cell wall biosynthesis
MWNVRHSLYDLRHEKRLTQYMIRLNSRLSSRADAIIYNSSVARRQHEDFGFASGKSLVIPNGFDLSRWGAFVSEPEISRWTLGVPNDAVVVGHVARFHPMKDHDLFVRIMVRLMRRHPRLCVILAGKGIVQDNGTLMQLIPEEFRHRFFLLGERSDVPALMRMMDVFCLSSRWGEAFPNVLGEAMASGLPAVVTNVGDCAEILGESGFVVPPGDEGALHDALEKMLRLTAGERERLGNMARGRVERDYNLATIIDRYAELYGAYAQETGRAS